MLQENYMGPSYPNITPLHFPASLQIIRSACGSMHFPMHLHGRMRVRNPGHTALRKHEMCVRASAVHVAAG